VAKITPFIYCFVRICVFYYYILTVNKNKLNSIGICKLKLEQEVVNLNLHIKGYTIVWAGCKDQTWCRIFIMV